MAFVIDQQQYLQGYEPIQILYLYTHHHGNALGVGNSIPTGPLVVTKANASRVEAATKAGED